MQFRKRIHPCPMAVSHPSGQASRWGFCLGASVGTTTCVPMISSIEGDDRGDGYWMILATVHLYLESFTRFFVHHEQYNLWMSIHRVSARSHPYIRNHGNQGQRFDPFKILQLEIVLALFQCSFLETS